MHSCVRAGAFFLQRLLQNVDCEKLNFGGAVRGQTQLPQREACGAGSSSGNFCLRQGVGQEAGSGKLVWPEFAGAIFFPVFGSLWFFFCAFFVCMFGSLCFFLCFLRCYFL